MSRRMAQDKRLEEVKGSFGTAWRKSGIEDFSFHGLRHTFPSNLPLEGVDLVTPKDL